MPYQSKVERLQVGCPFSSYPMTLSKRKTCFQGIEASQSSAMNDDMQQKAGLGFATVVCQDTKSICIEFNRKRRLYPKSTFKQRSRRSKVVPFWFQWNFCTFVVWRCLKMSQPALLEPTFSFILPDFAASSATSRTKRWRSDSSRRHSQTAM